MRFAATAIVLAGLATPAPPAAADDTLLARFAGEWIGRGIFRQGPEGDPENVYCKITNALADGGDELTMRGRCALASNTAAISFTITAEGGGRYSGGGGGLGIAARGQATVTGIARGSRIDLSAELLDTVTEKSSTGTATIDVLADGSYRIRARATQKATGISYTAAEVLFEPQ